MGTKWYVLFMLHLERQEAKLAHNDFKNSYIAGADDFALTGSKKNKSKIAIREKPKQLLHPIDLQCR